MTYVITEPCIRDGSCEAVCPVDAISEGEDAYKIDAELCTKCGICSRVCPYGAITADKKTKTKAQVVEAACAGCGKIDHPDEILRKRVNVDDALRAVDECGAPVVSIPGGEPLIHHEMPEIVRGIIARKKFVYLCTNALLLERKVLDDWVREGRSERVLDAIDALVANKFGEEM